MADAQCFGWFEERFSYADTLTRRWSPATLVIAEALREGVIDGEWAEASRMEVRQEES